MKFPCPFCAGRIGATKDFFGLSVPCPHCGKQIVVPGGPAVRKTDAPAATPPESGGAPQPQPAPVRSRRIRSIFGFATFALVLAMLGFFWWKIFPGKSPLSLPAGWLSSPEAHPKMLSCRLVECRLDTVAQQLLGQPDPADKILVAVRLGIPVRCVIPSAAEYETMRRNASGNWSFPSVDHCRWYDARKFTLAVPGGSRYEGLALCRFGRPNVLTGLGGTGWSTTLGEFRFTLSPSAFPRNRAEEVEVCFAVSKEEAESGRGRWQLQFAGFQLPFDLKPGDR